MAVIAGMTAATVDDIKPFELPIEQMASGLVATQKRADEVKNTIALGESALKIETRPLEGDWKLAKTVEDEFTNEWQTLLDNAGGDFSKVDRFDIQKVAMKYANDDRIRLLTHAKVEHDIYNKTKNEINKENGTPLDLGDVNPLVDDLYNEDGTAKNFSLSKLQIHLDWQKAQESMFFDPVLGQQTVNTSGYKILSDTDQATAWDTWFVNNENNYDALKAAFQQAAKYYVDNTKEGKQNKEWLIKQLLNKRDVNGNKINYTKEQLDELVNEHFTESFRLLMEKRKKNKTETGSKLTIENKTPKDPTGRKRGGGNGEDDVPEIPPTTAGINYISHHGNIKLVGGETPAQAAYNIKYGGGKIEGDVNQVVKAVIDGGELPSLNLYDELLTTVQGDQKASDGSRGYAGILQTLDATLYNPNSGPNRASLSENRAVMKISHPSTVIKPNNPAGITIAQMAALPSGTRNQIKKDILEGKYTYDDVFQNNDELISPIDIDEIGEMTYGVDDWNKNKNKYKGTTGYTSSIVTTQKYDQLHFVENPMITNAITYYNDLLGNNPNLKPETKRFIQNKIELLKEKQKQIEQYKGDHAAKLLQIQGSYNKMNERAKYLEGMHINAAIQAGIVNDEEFKQLDNLYKRKNGNQSINDVYVNDVNKAAEEILGPGYAGASGVTRKYRAGQLSREQSYLYAEMDAMAKQVLYNSLNHEEIYKWKKNNKGVYNGNYFYNLLIEKAKKSKTISDETIKRLDHIGTGGDLPANDFEASIFNITWTLNKKFNDEDYNEKASEYKNIPELSFAFHNKLKEVVQKNIKYKEADPKGRLVKYFEIIEDMKKDFTYRGMLYGTNIFDRDTKELGNVAQAVSNKISTLVSGSQMYNVTFNTNDPGDGKMYRAEEVSEEDIHDYIDLELRGVNGDKNVEIGDIDKYWQKAYQGLRFEPEAHGGKGAYVMQFKLNFPNASKKNPDLKSTKFIEIPLDQNEFSQSQLEQWFGIKPNQHLYFTQMHQSFQSSGGLYYEIGEDGANSKKTRFNVAYASMGNGIEKGDLYIVGDGTPGAVFDPKRITKINGPEHAMSFHMDREYDPETEKQKLTLYNLVDYINEIETKWSFRPEMERQNLIRQRMQMMGLPPMDKNQKITREIVYELINTLKGIPGGVGKTEGDTYTLPNGNQTISISETKQTGNLLIGNKQVLNKGAVVDYSSLTMNEAIAIAAVYRPDIIDTQNGKEVVQVKGKAFVNDTKRTDIVLKTANPADYKFLVLPNGTEHTYDQTSILKFFDYLEDWGETTGNKPMVVSGRRSLQEQLGAYSGKLDQLTNSEHLYGGSVDLDLSGTTLIGGDEQINKMVTKHPLLSYLASEEGERALKNSGLVAMVHTLDKTGQTGWHVHIEKGSDAGGKCGIPSGAFIRQDPKLGLSVVTHNYTNIRKGIGNANGLNK